MSPENIMIIILYCHHFQCSLTLFLTEEVQEVFLDFDQNKLFGFVIKDVHTCEQMLYVYKSSVKDISSEVYT